MNDHSHDAERLEAAFRALEAVLIECRPRSFRPHQTGLTPAAFAKLYRQHLIESMSCVEQTGVDACISCALEAFDRRAEQEGLGPLT